MKKIALYLLAFMYCPSFVGAQNDYQFFSPMDFSNSKRTSEDLTTGIITGPTMKKQFRLDALYAQTYESKVTVRGDASFIPLLQQLLHIKIKAHHLIQVCLTLILAEFLIIKDPFL